MTARRGSWSDRRGNAPGRLARGWLCGCALGGRPSAAWRLAGAGAWRAARRCGSLPRRGPAATGAGWPQPRTLQVWGAVARPGRPEAGRWPRGREGQTGRAGVTQQPVLPAERRGKARPGGLDLYSNRSSDGLSSRHCCFKTDPGDASFSKGLCCCSVESYNKLTEKNLLSLLRAGDLCLRGRWLARLLTISEIPGTRWHLFHLPVRAELQAPGVGVLEVGEGALAGC